MRIQVVAFLFAFVACGPLPPAPTSMDFTAGTIEAAAEPAPTPTPEVVCPDDMVYLFGPTRCMDAQAQIPALFSTALAACAARSLSMCAQHDYLDGLNLFRDVAGYYQTPDPAPEFYTAMVADGYPSPAVSVSVFSYRCCGVIYE